MSGKFRTFGKLPGQPSALLRLALHDLEKIENDQDYTVNMINWHIYRLSLDRCEVCLAGAVMAKTLEGDRRSNYWNVNFYQESPALDALDYFRVGKIGNALDCLGQTEGVYSRGIPLTATITRYQDNPKQFKKEIEELGSFLEDKGL